MMATNLEQRTFRLETLLAKALKQIEELQAQVGQLQQNQHAMSQGGFGGGGGATAFFCLPTSLGAASGTWPSLTPGSQSGLNVYNISSGALNNLGTFTVYNWYPATPAASKVLFVLPDGAGNYVAVAQSCT